MLPVGLWFALQLQQDTAADEHLPSYKAPSVPLPAEDDPMQVEVCSDAQPAIIQMYIQYNNGYLLGNA